jgi:hypothetical protein
MACGKKSGGMAARTQKENSESWSHDTQSARRNITVSE